MTNAFRRRSLSFNRFTFIRFASVALLGEAIYFMIYGLIMNFTNSTFISLAIAGGICILLNSYNHSRVTFRVKFTRSLFVGYLQIQLLGFFIAFLIGLLLDGIGTNKWVISLVTYSFWAIVSYVLTRILYQSSGRKLGLFPITPKNLQP